MRSFLEKKNVPVVLVMVALLGVSLAFQTPKAPGAQPSINDSWKSKEIAPLVDRLETESREIYREHKNIAAVVGPPKGAAVADVGAGSGFMAQEFARLVGPEGKVFAVDINATLLDRVVEQGKASGLNNIEPITCPENSTNLPANSVDIVFICDTYHHFVYPKETMQSIHRALRPGGQVVLIDFSRGPGTEAWMMEHVRAGKDVFVREIEAIGFRLANEHKLPFLEENYMVRFVKE